MESERENEEERETVRETVRKTKRERKREKQWERQREEQRERQRKRQRERQREKQRRRRRARGSKTKREMKNEDESKTEGKRQVTEERKTERAERRNRLIRKRKQMTEVKDRNEEHSENNNRNRKKRVRKRESKMRKREEERRKGEEERKKKKEEERERRENERRSKEEREEEREREEREREVEELERDYREREERGKQEAEKREKQRVDEAVWWSSTYRTALERQNGTPGFNYKKAAKHTFRKLWKKRRKAKAKAAKMKQAEEDAERAAELKRKRDAKDTARRKPIDWDNSNKVFFGRIVLSKKRHLWRKLDWVHCQKKGGVWVPRKMSKRHKKKLKVVQKMIAEAEDVVLEMLPSYTTTTTNLESTVEHPEYDLVLDSGAMVPSGDADREVGGAADRRAVEHPVAVKGVHGEAKPVKEQFTMKVPVVDRNGFVSLKKALHIPGTPHGLVSVSELDKAGMTTTFKKGEGRVTDRHGNLVMYAQMVNGLYKIRKKILSQYPQHVVNYDVGSLMRAHEVLGHRSFNAVRRILNFPPESNTDVNPVCKACCEAQMRKGKTPTEGLEAAPRKLFRLHSDTSRKKAAANAFGEEGLHRYVLTGDEFTDYLYVDFGARKSDTRRKLISRFNKLNNKWAPLKIVEHQTDSGKEYKQKLMRAELEKLHITPRYSSPHCQYQNGWIESRMGDIDRAARAMMFRGNAEPCDWPYAIRHAVRLHNMLPTLSTGRSPYEKSTGLPNKVPPGKIRGNLFCRCYAKVFVKGSEERAARPCIYLGRDPEGDGFLVRVLGGKRTGKEVRPARVITFDTDTYPYTNDMVAKPDAPEELVYESDSDQEEYSATTRVTEVRRSKVTADGIGSESDADTDTDVEVERHHEGTLRGKLEEEEQYEEEYEDPDGDISGEPAWEIEEILAEKRHKKAPKKGWKAGVYYKVKWKDCDEPDWRHAKELDAPDVVQRWEDKKKAKDGSKEEPLNLVMRVCQLNNTVEVLPEKSAKEANPFKELFDPATSQRIAPPKGYQNMLKHVFAEYFKQALIREKLENKKWNTYVEVERSSVPKGTKFLKPVTAYDIKYNQRGEIEKFKSRVCLDGSRTTVDPSETYESIASTGTIRMLLCIAARYGLGVAQTDVKNFFLQAVMPEGKEYYAEIPDGWAEGDPAKYVAKVLAPWYGLKESAKLAGDQLAEIMKTAGLVENRWMPKVFVKWKGDDVVICATHIDDGVWIYSNKKMLEETLDKIDESFEMTRNMNPTKVLGLEINYDQKRGIMKLHQESYNNSKLMEEGVKVSRDVKSPGYIPQKVPNPDVKAHEVKADAKSIRAFQKKVGIHMWGLQTDPSAMFVVHRLASKMLNPQKDDWHEMKRLEEYKATYPAMGIVFRRAASKEKLKRGSNLDCLTYYADADLAGDKTSAKSTSGYCVHLGESGMFDWKSKKQTCVCQSSCESEIYSSKECTCHAIWLRNALTELGFAFTKPTPICQDNQSAISLCTSDKHHSRTRHFRLHINLLKDNARKRVTCYPWIPTREMKGDLFNKAHGPSTHMDLCELNSIHYQKIELLSEQPVMLQIDGWREKEAARKKALEAIKIAKQGVQQVEEPGAPKLIMQ